MIGKHEYDVEEIINVAENEFGVRSYKIERCKRCYKIKVSFQKYNGEWGTLSSKNESPCKEASDQQT